MAKNFRELEAKMSPEALARSTARAQTALAELPLAELRAARELTQTSLAQTLEISQSDVSKIEKRTDMYVSTLASYIKAMGGTLEIRAVFPEGSVKIKRFDLVEGIEFLRVIHGTNSATKGDC